jgi:hypothetical protein
MWTDKKNVRFVFVCCSEVSVQLPTDKPMSHVTLNDTFLLKRYLLRPYLRSQKKDSSSEGSTASTPGLVEYHKTDYFAHLEISYLPWKAPANPSAYA